MADAPDNWSWKKLLLGVFDGRNYAKALVFGVCLAIIITLSYCVITVVKSRIIKPIPTQSVETNQGEITTNNIDETKKGWQLFGGLVQINN